MNPIEIYGPQGEYVAALVERGGCLTRAEERRLDRAWSAQNPKAWNAAREAARSVTEDDDVRRPAAYAAWVDAWRALDLGGWAEAGAAAAVALAVRDLVGYGDFTWADYDLLTGPWRQVIGPIHPDDELELNR
jgi:hypothetical protein